MTTIATQTHLPPLGGHVREEVGRLLQDSLVELLGLSLIGKQLHWSVIGPLFRTVHTQLDELVDSWRDLADTVAERAVAIGIWPDGRASAIVEASGLNPSSAERSRTRRSFDCWPNESPKSSSGVESGWIDWGISTRLHRTR